MREKGNVGESCDRSFKSNGASQHLNATLFLIGNRILIKDLKD